MFSHLATISHINLDAFSHLMVPHAFWLTGREYYTINIWSRSLASGGLDRGSPCGLNSVRCLWRLCRLLVTGLPPVEEKNQATYLYEVRVEPPVGWVDYWRVTCRCWLQTSARRPLQWNLSVSWIDHNDVCLPKMNLVEDIIKSSTTADLLPHLHELVDDKASNLDGQRWVQLTALLQRNVDLFLFSGQT